MATAHSEAAVVVIDVGATGLNISGANGGVAPGGSSLIGDWLGPSTGTLGIANNASNAGNWGLFGSGGLEFAIGSSSSYAIPHRFEAGQLVNVNVASFSNFPPETLFRFTGEYGSGVSGDFSALPKSFMGFRFGSGSNWNYGYLEVTWTASSNTFQILSGAYQSTANTAIAAGATPVPAPSALALLALGGGAFRRARARAA